VATLWHGVERGDYGEAWLGRSSRATWDVRPATGAPRPDLLFLVNGAIGQVTRGEMLMYIKFPVISSLKQFRQAVYLSVTASLFAACGGSGSEQPASAPLTAPPPQVTSVDADAFAAGAVLTNAFPGVALSVVTGPNRPDGPYYVISATGFNDFTQSNLATTGSRVFGNSPDAPPPAAKGWELDGRVLRADFAKPTDRVSIDLIADDMNSGVVSAYNIDGGLLETVTVRVLSGGAHTVTITRPTADIAYMTASGIFGETMILDNLRYSKQP
jgi:hypothetical protein